MFILRSVVCLMLGAALVSGGRLARQSSWYVDPRDPDPTFLYGSFPAGFMWGTSTAAGQVEGASSTDGRGPSIWDVYAKVPGVVANGDSPDVACDSYNNWQQDIDLVKGLGSSHYRFSISWSRVLPDGTLGSLNQAGIDYYNKLIDGLLAVGVQPMVTLYHNDLPNALQVAYRGWLSADTIPFYADYVRLMFKTYGDRVKWWSTFNEIHIMSMLGYGVYGSHAPGNLSWPDTAVYNVTRNCLLAHAQAFHIYDQEFRPTQNGKIGITIDMDWQDPADPTNPDDVAAAERQRQLNVGLIAHPIFSATGDWPDVLVQAVAAKSQAQGYPSTRLPPFSADEIATIKGSADYFSMNQYSTQLIKNQVQPIDNHLYLNDIDTQQVAGDPNWPTSGSGWLLGVPWGMRKVLNWIKDQYNNPPVIITENGVSEINPPQLQDDARINWLTQYTNNVLKAINIDGCNVFGYTIWSLMDNFEWAGGYGQRFGIVNVDFNDPARPRTPKKSYSWYKQLISDNGFHQ